MSTIGEMKHSSSGMLESKLDVSVLTSIRYALSGHPSLISSLTSDLSPWRLVASPLATVARYFLPFLVVVMGQSVL